MNNTHTNNSNRFQIVGNCTAVISEHDTLGAAVAELNAMPHIDDTEWATIQVVEPGQTVSGRFQQGLTTEQIECSGSLFGDWA